MQKIAKELALKNAIEKLKSIDIIKQCNLLNIDIIEDKFAYLKIFGKNIKWDFNNFIFKDEDVNNFLSTNEMILIYHYLLNEKIPDNTNNLISFRELQSGNFYYEPFLKRTTVPLVLKIKNNLNKLEENLNKYFIWEKLDMGDFAAKITVIQNIYIVLVYYLSDDEFDTDAKIFFDESIKSIFCTEDIVVLSSMVCLKLIQ